MWVHPELRVANSSRSNDEDLGVKMDWGLGRVQCQDGPPYHDTFCQDENCFMTLFEKKLSRWKFHLDKVMSRWMANSPHKKSVKMDFSS